MPRTVVVACSVAKVPAVTDTVIRLGAGDGGTDVEIVPAAEFFRDNPGEQHAPHRAGGEPYKRAQSLPRLRTYS